MKYWLLKSEPSELSIDDLIQKKDHTIDWFGIRNYQARNFMRDEMEINDLAFFWHSSCKNPGIYGIVKIVSTAYPDSSQFEITNKYYDPKSKIDNPRWWNVDVKFIQKTPFISIAELRKHLSLSDMQVLQKGNRLSITPVDYLHWKFINSLIKS